MSETIENKGASGFELELRQDADKLVEHLANGDVGAAMTLIHDLNEKRHQALYHEVGTLTRSLHNAIVSFSDDVSSNAMLQDSKEHIASISDASDRLSYVIELTESNAHKTIDSVDLSLNLVSELEEGFRRRQRLLEEFDKVQQDKPELEGLYKLACQHATDNSDALVELKERLTNILLAQEYQDITGQLIKRVIQLVTDIESQLVNLMEVASRVNRLNGIDGMTADAEALAKQKKIMAEGPQMAAKDNDEVASSQDDVDDLLSSLGF